MELASLSHTAHGYPRSWFHFPQASLAWEVREECWVERPQRHTSVRSPGMRWWLRAALGLQFGRGPGDALVHCTGIPFLYLPLHSPSTRAGSSTALGGDASHEATATPWGGVSALTLGPHLPLAMAIRGPSFIDKETEPEKG